MAEKNERENKRTYSVIDRKIERKTNFYAKTSKIKRAMFLNQPMIVLLYKETYLNTNKLDMSFLSSIVSFLQDFDDVFLEEVPHGLLPI